jgi:hypothetical protein
MYAFYAGIIITLVPYLAFDMGISNSEGKSDDLWVPGEVSFFVAVLVFHLTVFIQIRNWTWFLSLMCFISIVTFPLIVLPLTDFAVGN